MAVSTGKVELLDCTIRDGGYFNNWDFDSKLVRETYKALSKAGVDIVELGFRSTRKYFDPDKFGKWRFSPEDDLEDVTKNISGAKISLMIDFGKVDLVDIPDASESLVSLYRIACNKDKVLPSIELCDKIKEKGYSVSIQLMGIVNYTEDDFETFDEFLSSASDLVNAVNEIENVHLVIRLHPGRKTTPAEFKSLLPPSNKLTVTSFERPFFEILTLADLVISFSSTVIEDALQSHIPVLLLDKWNRYMHYKAEKLEANKGIKLSPVYYANNSKNLKNGIQWILENHLNKNVSKSIFDEYVFRENYFNDLVEFFDNKVNR